MNRGAMFFGLAMIGSFFVHRPMSLRSPVSTREWSADPDAAERKHGTRANYLGKSIAVVGGVVIVYGLF